MAEQENTELQNDIATDLSKIPFHKLRQDQFTEVEIEFMVGYRSNSKIIFCVTDNQMYSFNTKSVLGISYLCSFLTNKRRECKSRIYEVQPNQFIKLVGTPMHNHQDRLQEKKELCVLNEIKQRCGQLDSFLSTTRLTVRDIFNQVLLQNPDVKLEFKKFERTLQLIRDKTIPKNPKSVEEINEAFRNEEVMSTLGRSKHLDHDIFFDTCIETATHSFCVFSSKYSVSLIKSHIEPNRRHYMVDATFKVVPVGPFNQLLIIYVCYIKSVFPFVFILMSRKTEEAYIDVFRYINDNVIDLECAKFSSDYEMGLRNAIAKLCPTATQIGCWFHFCQAVRRYASKISDFLIYLRSEREASTIFRQLLCLPLLPADHILATFKLLEEKAYLLNRPKFLNLVVYFKRQWIVREGPEKITVFGQDFRTTSQIEAYNHQLGEMIAKNSGFFRFLVALGQQEYIKSNEMELYIKSGGSTAYKQKKFYMNRNKRIAEASELLSTGTLTPIDFINRILYDDEYLSEGLTKFADGAVTGDDESELIREVESELSQLQDDDTASNGNNDNDEPKEGTCITCLTSLASIVFPECSHMPLCTACYKQMKEIHYRDSTELKCPYCSTISSNVIEVRVTSFN